ncbi:unnamed protein product, partial [Didymodactylos carnosus]
MGTGTKFFWSRWSSLGTTAIRYRLERGVLGIVWHGYGDEEKGWQERKKSLMTVLAKPLSKYVIHSVSFGSEPLYSWSVGGGYSYLNELMAIKAELKPLGIPLTVSEMKYGYDVQSSIKQQVINAIDFVSAHVMPYYGTCKMPGDVWWDITNDIDQFQKMIP